MICALGVERVMYVGTFRNTKTRERIYDSTHCYTMRGVGRPPTTYAEGLCPHVHVHVLEIHVNVHMQM